jgi:hypothetical protein
MGLKESSACRQKALQLLTTSCCEGHGQSFIYITEETLGRSTSSTDFLQTGLLKPNRHSTVLGNKMASLISSPIQAQQTTHAAKYQNVPNQGS